jgi:hypothetical protein
MKKQVVMLLICSATVYGADQDWQAQWIWMPANTVSNMMLARKTFTLLKVSEKAQLSITASSQYELYVNSQYMARGPARCASHHQSFDVHDVTDLLQAGQNVLAIRVHFQREGISFYDTARAGLLVQLHGATRDIWSDASWRVQPDESWHNAAPPMARFHLEVCDRVDLRRRIKGWTTLDFDDRDWPRAEVLKRTSGWPLPPANDHPTHLIPPWTSLVERDIPYLKETVVSGVEPVMIHRLRAPHVGDAWADAPVITKIPVSANKGKPGRITANDSDTCRVLVYDLGEVKNGRPYLEIEAPSGTVVDVMAAPYLLGDCIRSPIVDSTYVDRIILSGDRERWEAFYSKPMRWMAVVFRRLSGEAMVYDAGLVQSKYPFTQLGHFQARETPELHRLWTAATKTIDVCTIDAYTDNYRERRQYAQTAYYACLGNYAIFGDTKLQRRYLVQIAQEQLANGIMPAYAPRHGNDFMVILDSNCFWLRGLHQYLLYSGDTTTTRELLPAARKLLELLHSYTNALGLIDSPAYPYWLDHAVNDRRGANFCLNAHYLGALEDFTRVLTWLNEPDPSSYQTRANQVREALREQLWDSQRKLFCDAIIDGQRSSLFSEHANAMALAMDVATPRQAKLINHQLLARDSHDYIRRESGLTMVTPAMSYYLHAGLCKHGYVAESLRMLQDRFNHMLHPGTNGTLWEEWWLDGTGRTGKLNKHKTRSDAQTESAFPPALLVEYILGIRPMQPGLRKVTLFRSRSGLRDIEGSIPSPEGILSVHWRFEEDIGGALKVTVPGEMKVQLDLKSLGIDSERSVMVDGQVYQMKQERSGSLLLTKGAHQVRF